MPSLELHLPVPSTESPSVASLDHIGNDVSSTHPDLHAPVQSISDSPFLQALLVPFLLLNGRTKRDDLIEMPEAIATTKRKFHKLLDSLIPSHAIVPHTTTVSAPSAVLTTRERFEQASERARKRQRQSDSTLALSTAASSHNGSTTTLPRKTVGTSSTITKSSKDTNGVKETDRATPNFSPWSQETFLQRLRTFSRVSLWHPKPEAISEVEWAKRGWVCADVNTVACQGGCGRRVVVKLESPERHQVDGQNDGDIDEDDADDADADAALEQMLISRYQHEIIEGHTESCLWRKAGCKEDIYRLSVVRPAVWQPEIRTRYASLLDITDSIKDVTLRSTQREGGSQSPPDRLLAELPIEILPSSDASAESKAKALGIAMHGWRATSESYAELLHCDACFQRVGLWMYQPGYRTSSSSTTADEEEDTGPPTIDLVEMHREHCPWRNAQSQHASGSLAGLNACEILGRVVSTYAREQRRRTAERAVPRPEDLADVEDETPLPVLSRDEVDRLDKERESKLQRLKKLFSIKRPSRPR